MIPVVRPGAAKALVTIFSAALVAAPTACDSTSPEARGPIDDDTYVMVMSELADIRRFPPGGRDQTSRDVAADSARRAVLDRFGVTVDELLTFAEIVGDQPARMVEIGERISAVTDSLAELRRRGERTEADTAGGGAGTAQATDTTDAAAESAPDDGTTADSVRDSARDAALRERIERFRERRDGERP